MELNVFYQNKQVGKVTGSSIIPFAQYCEEQGFQVKWNIEDKNVHVTPGLQSQRINIVIEAKDREEPFQTSFIKELKQYLDKTGIQLEENTGFLDQDINLNMKLTTPSFSESLNAPKIIIFYRLTAKYEELIALLQYYLKSFDIDYECISKKNDIPQSSISLKSTLPKQYQSKQLQSFQDKLCFVFSLSISLFFSNKEKRTALSFTSATLSPFLQEDRKEKTITPSKRKKDLLSFVKDSNSNVSNKKTHAEIFFNYTVFPSRSKEQFIATGDLHIKNTGDLVLENPLICLKVHPAEQISIGGQILPPSMTKTLGIHGTEGGLRGWKFMDNDWFQKAQERGEYWIGAIDNPHISPGESIALPNFQITIVKPEKKITAVIDSIVYFQDKDIPFPSNNSIKVSF